MCQVTNGFGFNNFFETDLRIWLLNYSGSADLRTPIHAPLLVAKNDQELVGMITNEDNFSLNLK